MKFENLSSSEALNHDYIVATYALNSKNNQDIFSWASLIASDQSAGTWTHVEGETPEVIEKYGAKIIGIFPGSEGKSAIIRVAFPVRNFQPYIPMLLSTVAGNVLGQEGIKLVDIDFNEAYLKNYTGPLVGADGIRELLGVKDRPILGAILKPCIGVAPSVSAEGAQKAALGGAEVIKDDELLGDPDYSNMVERTKTVMAALKSVGKDKSTLYSVNITGQNIVERAKRAIEAGANSIMVNYFTLGWGATEDLIRFLEAENIKIPVFGHLAGIGATYTSSTSGMSVGLSCGKLPRLLGMDMPLVYPDSGRFGITTNDLIDAHRAAIAPMNNIKKALITVAGGVHPGTIEYLMGLLGNDTILMAGGGIYGHPDGAEAGAKAILQAMELVMDGKGVKESSSDFPELDAALKFWS